MGAIERNAQRREARRRLNEELRRLRLSREIRDQLHGPHRGAVTIQDKYGRDLING